MPATTAAEKFSRLNATSAVGAAAAGWGSFLFLGETDPFRIGAYAFVGAVIGTTVEAKNLLEKDEHARSARQKQSQSNASYDAGR